MKTEKQIKYLRILNQQRKAGNLSKKEFKKELKWFRKNFNQNIPNFM